MEGRPSPSMERRGDIPSGFREAGFVYEEYPLEGAVLELGFITSFSFFAGGGPESRALRGGSAWAILGFLTGWPTQAGVPGYTVTSGLRNKCSHEQGGN